MHGALVSVNVVIMVLLPGTYMISSATFLQLDQSVFVSK